MIEPSHDDWESLPGHYTRLVFAARPFCKYINESADETAHCSYIVFRFCRSPPELPTNWLPVTVCRFCHLSLRGGDDLLDLVFGLAIRCQTRPDRLIPGRKPNLAWRSDHRRRLRRRPAGGTLPADDRLKSTNLVDREVLTMLQKRRYLPTRKRVVPPAALVRLPRLWPAL